MQSIWVVGDAAEIMKIPVEESSGYFTYGGNVYGNETFAPSYYRYFNGTNKCVPSSSVQASSNFSRRSF
jgi:hypothetical protein